MRDSLSPALSLKNNSNTKWDLLSPEAEGHYTGVMNVPPKLLDLY